MKCNNKKNSFYRGLMGIRNFCIQEFPFISNDFDSMTTYELLCKVICYLKDLDGSFSELYEKVIGLEDTVEEFVDEKIYNMLENGDFSVIFEKYGYLVSVKSFGAKGDGVTNDTRAFDNFYSSERGLKYIPSGRYLVGGEILEYEKGTIGNGIDYPLPTKAKDMGGWGEWAFDTFAKNAIVMEGDYITSPSEISPITRLSFVQDLKADHNWNTYNSGMVGVDVTGTLKGKGNGMPVGVRSSMYNSIDGVGDAVAIWGRVHKFDQEDAYNNSDCCGVHASAFSKSEGTGIIMASETWARNLNRQGSQGTNYSNYYEPGGVVCNHTSAVSNQGMNQTHILVSGARSYKYGAWSVMSIEPTSFKYNENTAYPEKTCILKAPDTNFNQCPNFGFFLGAMPYHVKMNGAYRYTVGADFSEVINSTASGDAVFGVYNLVENPSIQGPDTYEYSTIGLGFIKPDSTKHRYARAVNQKRCTQASLYTEYDHPTLYIRTLIPKKDDGTFEEDIYNRGAFRGRNIQIRSAYIDDDNNVKLDRGLYLSGSGHTLAPLSSGMDLGYSSMPWHNGYIKNIYNTSDERVKKDITKIDTSVLNIFKYIELKQFTFLNGDGKINFGVTAQDVINAFEKCGLKIEDYNIVVYDSENDTYSVNYIQLNILLASYLLLNLKQ